MKLYIKFIYVFIFFIFHVSLFSSIKEHLDEVKLLTKSMNNSRKKLNYFKSLIKKSETAIDRLKIILKNIKTQIPIKIEQKYKFEFRYYKNNIITYQSNKGLGIRISNKEKLYQSNIVTYTFEDSFQYKKKNELIQIFTNSFFYWKNKNKQGFKCFNNLGEEIYSYFSHFSFKTKKIINEKLVLKSGNIYQITLNSNFYKKNKKSQYFRFSNGHRLNIQYYFLIYWISDSIFYRVYFNGNISLSSKFRELLFKDKYYINQLKADFSHLKYVYYLNFLIKNNISLKNNSKIYLFLINLFRKNYGLKSLKLNNKLNKIAKYHGKYILKHKPKYLHYQKINRAGYFGKTPFQRRKYFKYPHLVNESISFGNDPIYIFYKIIQKPKWIYILLNPVAIHLGYFKISCSLNNRHNDLVIILIGKTYKISHKVILYPKFKIRLQHRFQIKILQKNEFCKMPIIKFFMKNTYFAFILNYSNKIILKEEIKLIQKLSYKPLKFKLLKLLQKDYLINIIQFQNLKVNMIYQINFREKKQIFFFMKINQFF